MSTLSIPKPLDNLSDPSHAGRDMGSPSSTEESFDELSDSDWAYALSEKSLTIWPTSEADADADTDTEDELEAGEWPSGESPLADIIMEDLAAGTPLTCLVWSEALQKLKDMPSHQRTAKALLGVLQPAISNEMQHWDKLTIMSNSCHIGYIQNLNFSSSVWECVRYLAGQEDPTWDNRSRERSPEWLDLEDVVQMLQRTGERIQAQCLGATFLREYNILRGIKRYESLWKAVVEILQEGRKGPRMQAYVNVLSDSASWPYRSW